MKNRKKVVVALLLVAVLCLGVGYAALTDNLLVNGNVSVKKNADAEEQFAKDVYFSGTPTVTYNTTGTSSGVTAVIGNESAADTDANDLLTITVPDTVLVAAGDKLTVKATITNDSADYRANVALANGTSTTAGLYSVTCAWVDSGFDGVIAKNGTSDVNITIELLKTPTEDIAGDTFSITFVATSVE